MLKFLSTANWPFAFKFIIPFLLALIVITFVEYISLDALKTVRASLHDVVERKYSASILLEQNVDRLRAINGDVYLLQVKKEADIGQDVNQESKRLSQELEKIAEDLIAFKAAYAEPRDAERIDSSVKNIKEYAKAVSFVGSMLDIDFKATVAFIMPLRGAYEEMIGNLSSLSDSFLRSSQEASRRADALARERTQIVISLSIGMLLITMSMIAPIVYSTIHSIKSLATATVQLADGDTHIDFQKLERHDELGRIVHALTVFRDNIERVTALKKISLLYAAMNAMMDSLRQGLFTFDAHGICNETYSKACLDLLKQPPAGKTLGEVLQLSPKQQADVANILRLIFSRKATMAAPPEMLLNMLPKHFDTGRDADATPQNEQPAISLNYTPIKDSSGQIQSVLVIATDHSQEIEAARLTQERQDKILGLQRILSDRNFFIQLFRDLQAYFSEPETLFADTPLDQIKRDIHTLKGTTGAFYLTSLASALHDLESVLPAAAGENVPGVQPSVYKAFEVVRDRLAQTQAELAHALGADFDRQGAMRMIPLTRLLMVNEALSPEHSLSEIRNLFSQQLLGEPVQKLLANTQREMRDLADRYGKSLDVQPIKGEDFSIIPEAYASVFASLTHIVRNIVKHAIDDEDTRKKFGKTGICVFSITTATFLRSNMPWFRIVFSDDGAGIDPGAIRDRLAKRGARQEVLNLNDELVIQHVFDGDMSTASGITQLGGRGIGMSAVKQAVESAGGSVHIDSKFHYSTRITVELPFIWTIPDMRQAG